MICLGIDPGMHFTGLAVCSPGKVEAVRIVRVARTVTGVDAVVEMIVKLSDAINEILSASPSVDYYCVEGQQKYVGAGAAPEDLLRLALVAGAAVSLSMELGKDGIKGSVPLPREWKGNVPKKIHNERVLSRLGLTPDTFGSLPGAEEIKASEREHVIDAVGLAQWAIRRAS